ncbi:hypothetical protein [Roseovarius sp. MMSF_3350]|uniref:hypothetical protein n=1 Tax=Roseovarius sp. MMSF_3350 TaxID=3046706 RepID=UPI00273DC164|nr:hypothetical protein [Roseovarius sp. MMSF_3350]
MLNHPGFSAPPCRIAEIGAATPINLEQFDFENLFQELHDWELVLNADQEVAHRLRCFDDDQETDEQKTDESTKDTPVFQTRRGPRR